eukprot:981398-Pyramimonas_sp.AAC.1
MAAIIESTRREQLRPAQGAGWAPPLELGPRARGGPACAGPALLPSSSGASDSGHDATASFGEWRPHVCQGQPTPRRQAMGGAHACVGPGSAQRPQYDAPCCIGACAGVGACTLTKRSVKLRPAKDWPRRLARKLAERASRFHRGARKFCARSSVFPKLTNVSAVGDA